MRRKKFKSFSRIGLKSNGLSSGCEAAEGFLFCERKQDGKIQIDEVRYLIEKKNISPGKALEVVFNKYYDDEKYDFDSFRSIYYRVRRSKQKL